MELAPLLLRQVAWLTAAISAIVGLVLICKAKGAAKFAGIMIVALPSIVFRTLLPIAPAETSSRELAALDRVFILRTLASMLMFWLILGITTGYLFGKRRGTSRSSSRWTDSGASRD
jgi:predicted cobalt transporter CbtA